ncbi:hypothetical protein [Aquabacterium sp.]|uniref:hypothetical protein n=1 Tax=Aquabacterium sp. TaxID=1872578 RepID=UPI0040377B15
MFPMTITISNIADLQKVQSVLYPTTGVIEVTDKTRDVSTTKTNDADLQSTINKAEANADPKPTKAAEQPAAQTAPTEPTAEAGKDTAQDKSDSKPLDYKVDVKPRILALIKAGKRDDVAKVLAGFGVENAQDLAPEKWPDLLAELAKLEG